MERFVFESEKPRFRVFLWMAEAGGVWAEFSPDGQYTTRDPKAAEKLRAMPRFGVDFYQVAGPKLRVRKERQPSLGAEYPCPFCDEVSSNPAGRRMHVLGKHKKSMTYEELEAAEKETVVA